MSRLRNILTIGAMATSGATAAQDVAAAFGAMTDIQVSERWRASATASVGHSSGDARSATEVVMGGIEFHLLGSAYVRAEGQAAFAQYFEIDNRDINLSLTETILFRYPHFVFGLKLEQKRLFFHPSDYAVTSTRATPTIAYIRRVGSKVWAVGGNVRCHLNMQAEIKDAPLMQRIRTTVFAERNVTDNLRLRFRYEYMHGGKRQPFIMERNNLHIFTTTFNINLMHDKSTD